MKKLFSLAPIALASLLTVGIIIPAHAGHYATTESELNTGEGSTGDYDPEDPRVAVAGGFVGTGLDPNSFSARSMIKGEQYTNGNQEDGDLVEGYVTTPGSRTTSWAWTKNNPQDNSTPASYSVKHTYSYSGYLLADASGGSVGETTAEVFFSGTSAYDAPPLHYIVSPYDDVDELTIPSQQVSVGLKNTATGQYTYTGQQNITRATTFSVKSAIYMDNTFIGFYDYKTKSGDNFLKSISLDLEEQ